MEQSINRALKVIAVLSTILIIGLGRVALASELIPQPFNAEAEGLCMSFESSDSCDERLYDLGDIDAACEGVECLVGGA